MAVRMKGEVASVKSRLKRRVPGDVRLISANSKSGGPALKRGH